MQGDGNGGCTKFPTHCLCSFLSRDRTPHTLHLLQHQFPPTGTDQCKLPQCEPFPWLQLFMNCFSVGPFHGVKPFRNRLLQTGVFSPLKYITPEAVPPLLLGFALASSRSTLELAGTSSAGHEGSCQKLLTEATPAPLWYQNWVTQTQYIHKGCSVTSLDISVSKALMVLKITYGTHQTF